jgi:hypothetical protein
LSKAPHCKGDDDTNGNGNGSGGSGNGNGGGSYNVQSENNSEKSKNSIMPNGIRSVSLWMLIAAAAAAVLAIGAVIMGQRDRNKEKHPLKGSVARRMGLFGQFADCALCDNASRPARVVEMTMSADDYDSPAAKGGAVV